MEKNKVEKSDEKIEEAEKGKALIKDQTKEQNKILRNFLIGIGIFIVVLVVVVLLFNSLTHFKYRGLEFNVEKFGDIIVYRTSVPVYSQTGVNVMTGEAVKEHTADYNFYLRNDPRKLDEVPYYGEIVLYKEVVINGTNELNCDGKGIIAIKNLANLYELIGANVIKDPNATCDNQGMYMFLDIRPGETTKIEQVRRGCYNLYANNCEILEVTERFMIETFVKIDEMGLEPTL